MNLYDHASNSADRAALHSTWTSPPLSALDLKAV